MTTLAEKLALILTTPFSTVIPDDEAQNMQQLLQHDGYGPAERANICARLMEAVPYTTTYEEWVVQAKLAVERA